MSINTNEIASAVLAKTELSNCDNLIETISRELRTRLDADGDGLIDVDDDGAPWTWIDPNGGPEAVLAFGDTVVRIFGLIVEELRCAPTSHINQNY